MKKIFAITISAFAMCASLQTSAQTDKGNFLVAGTCDLQALSSSKNWTDSDENGKSFKLNITPTAGYFVVNDLAVGGKLAFYYFSDDVEHNEFEFTYTSSSVALSPFVRYYFGSNKIRPFIELSAGYGKQKSEFIYENSNDNQGYSGDFKTAQLTGGFDLFLNDKVAIDLGLGYSYYSYKPNDKTRNDLNNYSEIKMGLKSNVGIIMVF